MTSKPDFPLEVAMIDGTKWLIYYRGVRDFAHALTHVRRDIEDGRLMPADDLDGVQRRYAQVNMRYIVSIREPGEGAAA